MLIRVKTLGIQSKQAAMGSIDISGGNTQTKAFSEHSLARKIAIVTAVKLLGLFVIWWVFFSESGDSKLTPEQVGSAILHPTRSNTTMP